jgi:hypothetical protein
MGENRSGVNIKERGGAVIIPLDPPLVKGDLGGFERRICEIPRKRHQSCKTRQT